MSTYASPIPGVADYGAAGAAALNAYNTAKTRLQTQRGDLLRQYGYTGTYGADGALTGVSVDPTNTQGQYQRMMQQQGLDLEHQHAITRGRGFSGGEGGVGRQEQQLRYGQEGQQTDMAQQLQHDTRGIQDQIETEGINYNNTAWQLQQAAAQQAIQNGNFNQGDYSGLDIPNYGDPAPSAAPGAKPAKAGTVQWAGRSMSRAQLSAFLKKNGSSYPQWARNHPGAAQQLG